MATEAALEKRIQKLKDKLRKARGAGDEAAPPPLIRRIRKRLKHNQRKLRARVARQKREEGRKGASASKGS